MRGVLLNSVVVVPFCLLAFAASAHAECAWVAWELGDFRPRAASPVNPGKQWRLLYAHSTRAECEQAALDAAAALRDLRRKDSSVLAVTGEGRNAEIEVVWGTIVYSYRCLPDIVDPRGPREK